MAIVILLHSLCLCGAARLTRLFGPCSWWPRCFSVLLLYEYQIRATLRRPCRLSARGFCGAVHVISSLSRSRSVSCREREGWFEGGGGWSGWQGGGGCLMNVWRARVVFLGGGGGIGTKDETRKERSAESRHGQCVRCALNEHLICVYFLRQFAGCGSSSSSSQLRGVHSLPHMFAHVPPCILSGTCETLCSQTHISIMLMFGGNL